MKRILLLGLAMALGSLNGCGTTCNLAGSFTHPETEPRVYGGVRRDLEFVDDVVQKGKPIGSDPKAVVVLVPFALAEAILTLVGDTLTLPITIYLQDRRVAASKCDHDSKPAASSGSASEDQAQGQPITMNPVDESQKGESKSQAPPP
jgi:hypothetical protein